MQLTKFYQNPNPEIIFPLILRFALDDKLNFETYPGPTLFLSQIFRRFPDKAEDWVKQADCIDKVAQECLQTAVKISQIDLNANINNARDVDLNLQAFSVFGDEKYIKSIINFVNNESNDQKTRASAQITLLNRARSDHKIQSLIS